MIFINRYWEVLVGHTYDPKYADKYDPSIKPEDYTWKVISKTEPDTPIEEDFNPWTDREYAL